MERGAMRVGTDPLVLGPSPALFGSSLLLFCCLESQVNCALLTSRSAPAVSWALSCLMLLQ